MISICIPTYNFDANKLVTALAEQMKIIKTKTEIIVIDDASTQYFPIYKASFLGVAHQYIRLKNNIGRAKIRNRFLQFAQYPYMIFLDGDSKIENYNFLQNYQDAILENQPKVCVGGRRYGPKPKNQDVLLRWYYGNYKESQAARIRSKNPSNNFLTNNFLIKKGVFDSVQFDESLSQYGHEDTLFGYQLMQNNIKVMHLENPVLNGHLESNQDFLLQTQKGITNLYNIWSKLDFGTHFSAYVKLLKYYQRIPLKISFFPDMAYKALQKASLPHQSLLVLFDVYKLFLIENANRNNTIAG